MTLDIDFRDRIETIPHPDGGEVTVRLIGGIAKLTDGTSYAEDVDVPIDASDQQVELVKGLIRMTLEHEDAAAAARMAGG